MIIRTSLSFLAILSFTACAALTSQISEDMSPRISTEVAVQVGTAVVEHVATALADDPSAAVTEEAGAPVEEEVGLVTRVIDGDTIDVQMGDQTVRVRYLQMNSPERDQPCSRDATQANAELVAGKTVRLVPDKELVDPYDRLLRYIYVGDVNVNRVLVEQGFAEVVLYPPNDAHYDEFLRLEQEAAAAGRGCHPTGIFDDGSTTR